MNAFWSEEVRFTAAGFGERRFGGPWGRGSTESNHALPFQLPVSNHADGESNHALSAGVVRLPQHCLRGLNRTWVGIDAV